MRLAQVSRSQKQSLLGQGLHCHITPKVPRALQDAQRTIRLVRARAKELNLDPNKIGVIGFSAGGYLVAQTSNIFEPTYKPVDAADKLSSRPDFAVALYPGHLCRENGNTLDPGIHVTKQTPPTFLLQAWDDPVDDICNSTVYARALDDAGVPAEVHLFAKGGHAFGLRRIQNIRWRCGLRSSRTGSRTIGIL
jgi:acetyl esterase/lipase